MLHGSQRESARTMQGFFHDRASCAQGSSFVLPSKSFSALQGKCVHCTCKLEAFHQRVSAPSMGTKKHVYEKQKYLRHQTGQVSSTCYTFARFGWL